MNRVTLFICDICNKQSRIDAEIVACEARGIPKAQPVGLVFGNASDKDHLSKGITLAIAKAHVDGHSVDYSLWACRDNGNGDSLGKELCGSPGGTNIYGVPDPDHPTFGRMISYLSISGIPITVWDGKQPVSVETFLARNERIKSLRAMGVKA